MLYKEIKFNTFVIEMIMMMLIKMMMMMMMMKLLSVTTFNLVSKYPRI